MNLNVLLQPGSMTLLGETHLAEVSLQYREEAASTGISAWWFCAIPILAIVVAWAIYALINRTPKIVNTPLGLLHELCSVHRINRRGRVLLEQIAQANSMNHPAVLFSGSTLFEKAVDDAGKQINFNKRQHATLGMLRRKLFT